MTNRQEFLILTLLALILSNVTTGGWAIYWAIMTWVSAVFFFIESYYERSNK